MAGDDMGASGVGHASDLHRPRPVQSISFVRVRWRGLPVRMGAFVVCAKEKPRSNFGIGTEAVLEGL